MTTIVYSRENFMQVCGCVCMWVRMFVYVHICVHYYRLVIKYHQLALQANNYIDLWLHNHQQNKQRNIRSGGRWNLISSAGEAKQIWLYWNPQNSHSSHQLLSPTTWVIIFNWPPHRQFQNAKLSLSNFTVTSPFNREINYTCISYHSSLEQTNKTKK